MKKRKKNIEDELMTTALRTLQEVSNNPTIPKLHEDFGRDVAATLRTMPESMADLAKLKIQEILYSVKYLSGPSSLSASSATVQIPQTVTTESPQ